MFQCVLACVNVCRCVWVSVSLRVSQCVFFQCVIFFLYVYVSVSLCVSVLRYLSVCVSLFNRVPGCLCVSECFSIFII